MTAEEATVKRQPRKFGWRFMVIGLVVLLLITAVVRAFWFESYYISSDSMEPVFKPGDRVIVSRTAYQSTGIQRGDIVVFDGRGSFDPANSGRGSAGDALYGLGQFMGVVGSDTIYVKRVIGIAGDTVRCCNSQGQVEVNGQSVDEPYLYPGDTPSDVPFEVQVPAEKLWLMGDHRATSQDSRSLLGKPGGGMIPVTKVVGKPVIIIWPWARLAKV